MTACTREAEVAGGPEHLIRIAIVDDDANARSRMKHTVDRSRGLKCVGFYGCGAEALKDIPSSASDVVLMDVRMPDMSGFECTRRLRNIRPDLFIIMISGLDHPETRAQACEAGADAFLPKPFSLCRFFKILRDCLQRRKLRVNETQTPRPARSTEQGLLAEDPVVRAALHRIVVRMEGNPDTQEDLFQEAWVCFWSREQQYPGQALRWYLQGVKFYLQNLRASGRSLDSPKRRGAQATLPDHCNEWDHWRDRFGSDDGMMSEVNAHDILSLLVGRLVPADQVILRAMFEGLGISEIAATLHVPRGFVDRHRLRIAKRAAEVGINPVPAEPVRLRRP